MNDKTVHTRAGYTVENVGDTEYIKARDQIEEAFFEDEMCIYCKRSFLDHAFQRYLDEEEVQRISAIGYIGNLTGPQDAPEVCWSRPGWDVSEEPVPTPIYPSKIIRVDL